MLSFLWSWYIKSKRYFLLFSGLLVSGGGYAQSFSELLTLARNSDPTYHSAQATVDMAAARKDQALGAMLPQLSATANTNGSRRSYNTRNNSIETEKDSYNKHAEQISLTQPLWHYANIVGWQESKLMTEQAEKQLLGAEQELMAKLVSGWFDVLSARDAKAFAQRQYDVNAHQLKIVTRGAELGLYQSPQLEEAKAKQQQSLADIASAEADYQIKVSALEQLIGPQAQLITPYMRDDAELTEFEQSALANWLELARQNNPALLAALKGYSAATYEVKKQQAGHLPTVDLVSSYGTNSQTVGGFPGQAGYDITELTVGVQVSMPLYSGGTQSAKVAEAAAQKEKARFDIEAARRAAVINVKQAWFGWQSARAKSVAGKQTIQSADAALKLARRGSDNGVKTELEVLQALQQKMTALRDYRKGRYDQITAQVKLKAVAGLLSTADVLALDALMVDGLPADDSSF